MISEEDLSLITESDLDQTDKDSKYNTEYYLNMDPEERLKAGIKAH
jgi:hypothetical protein